MSTVAEIEDAFSKLPETEFEEVAFVVLERLCKVSHLLLFAPLARVSFADGLKKMNATCSPTEQGDECHPELPEKC